MTLDELIAKLQDMRNNSHIKASPDELGKSRVYVKCQVPHVDGWLNEHEIVFDIAEDGFSRIVRIEGGFGA